MKTLITIILIWMVADFAITPSRGPIVKSIVGTTENADARKDFEKGLLLLHNFEYPDAADMFRSARKKDPHFALAYWGEAMTHNHPIWLRQNFEAGRKVINEYKEISQSSKRKLADLDVDLLQSLEILYGEGSKPARDAAYADFMATLHERYPDNHDVAAFYALSLMGEAGGWNEALCNKAAEIAGAILKENPTHPGALHYFIHAEDHPEFAKLAWDQANAYAKVASYSGHALHMPSHIYLALGLWDDVVTSNEVSWQAGVDRKVAKKLTNDALNYHAHWWLAYGYLQQGRFSKAEEVLRRQLALTRELSSPSARNHFVIMRGHYLAETNDWAHELASEEVKIGDLRIEIRNLDRFVKGLKAFQQKDGKVLNAVVGEIEQELSSKQQAKIINDGIAQCGTGSYGNAGLNQTAILLQELKALHAFIQNDHATADAHFRKAIELEDENGHFFGPPEILKPAYEFYGEFLLTTGKYDDAIQSFTRALQKSPGRNHALRGLSLAWAAKGDGEKEKQVRQQLEKNLHNAETSKLNGFFALP